VGIELKFGNLVGLAMEDILILAVDVWQLTRHLRGINDALSHQRGSRSLRPWGRYPLEIDSDMPSHRQLRELV